MALKKLAVRRVVAIRREETLGSDESLEPLDFTDSGTRDILEELYLERFGKDSLAELEEGSTVATVQQHDMPPAPTDHPPADGAGTSSTTLSVSTSMMISSIATASPGFFFHCSRVASATDSGKAFGMPRLTPLDVGLFNVYSWGLLAMMGVAVASGYLRGPIEQETTK